MEGELHGLIHVLFYSMSKIVTILYFKNCNIPYISSPCWDMGADETESTLHFYCIWENLSSYQHI